MPSPVYPTALAEKLLELFKLLLVDLKALYSGKLFGSRPDGGTIKLMKNLLFAR